MTEKMHVPDRLVNKYKSSIKILEKKSFGSVHVSMDGRVNANIHTFFESNTTSPEKMKL